MALACNSYCMTTFDSFGPILLSNFISEEENDSMRLNEGQRSSFSHFSPK